MREPASSFEDFDATEDPLDVPVPRKRIAFEPAELVDLGDIHVPETVRPKDWPAPPEDKPSLMDRVRTVWGIVALVVAEAIPVAERLLSDKSGSEKKGYVVATMMQWLDQAENRFDILPGWLEPAIMRLIRLAMGIIVERVFGALESRGVVNV